jgi:hypothetical protein
MRNLHEIDKYRFFGDEVIRFFGSVGDHSCGMFLVPSLLDGQLLKVIAGSSDGWDHVSVSRMTRCPTWSEMDYIKRMFFKEDEVAMQLHVTPKNHIDCHPFCLHLWRPLAAPIPLPPQWMV